MLGIQPVICRRISISHMRAVLLYIKLYIFLHSFQELYIIYIICIANIPEEHWSFLWSSAAFSCSRAWKYIKHSCFILYLCFTDYTACFMQGSPSPLCRWRFVYSHNAAEKAAIMTVRKNRKNQAIATFPPLNIWKGLARSEGELKTKKLDEITSMGKSWDCLCSCGNW